MKILINNEEETLTQKSISVTELLKLKAVKMPDMVSVQLNGDILKRKAFDTTWISDSDQVNFLYFMGGGADRNSGDLGPKGRVRRRL